MVYVEDNKNEYKCPIEDMHNLLEYGNKSISDLVRDCKNIIIYPIELSYSTMNKDSHIFDVTSFQQNEITIKTGNIIGFIGKNNQRIVIHSRFDNYE